MWESKMDINEVREIRAKTITYLGVGAIKKISDIAAELKKTGVNKLIVMTGKGAYKRTGAWDYVEAALKANGIEYVLYNKVTPNPTDAEVDEAVKIAKDFGAQAVIPIGGGSSIDAGKAVAVLLKYPGKPAEELMEGKFPAENAVPIIAINLTHGTGSESDRFAVVTITKKQYKPCIVADCIYPKYAIDDPALMAMLPVNQTCFVSVDAVNHVLEAATSKIASPYTVMLAKETIRLVGRYLPQAMAHPQDLTARYYLAYAALIAGICFDNGLLHFTHALEHPLSAIKPEVVHGQGLGILLPAVIKQIYPAVPEVVADIFSSVVPGLKGEPQEAEVAGDRIEAWLKTVGITVKLTDLGFSEKDLDRLVDLAFTTPSLGVLLSVAPIEATRENVRQIFADSL
ncbi:MAG: iron-containing alcohol dehydrogenase [Clostridiaceae bacterium]